MSINYFDEIFFSKYIQEEDEVLDICHKHLVTIIDTIVVWMFFWVILISFFYYNNTFWARTLIPFIYFEAYLVIIYLIITHKIFDWYNDVWIITERWIIDLDWQFFKTNIVFIDYKDVKWIELRQDSMWDWLLHKWDIALHLEWEWAVFILEEAKNPMSIIEYIQEIIDEREKKKKDKDVTLTDRLFSTLRWMVKEYLETEWSKQMQIDESVGDDSLDKDNALVEKTLKKKWTIDLR